MFLSFGEEGVTLEEGYITFTSLPGSIVAKAGKMRSLPKLIPGVHHKLPGDAQDHVQRIYAHAEEHQVELNLYIRGEEGDADESVPEAEAVPETEVQPEPDEVRDQ